MIRPKLGVVVIVSPLEVGAGEASKIRRKAISNLGTLNIDLVIPEIIIKDEKTAKEAGKKFRKDETDLICLVLGTWSEDHLVIDLLEEIDVPLITWALPGIHTGSLCGCHQICSVLKELGKIYKFVYGELDDKKALHAIDIYSRAVSLRKKLRKAKIGLIGHRIKGMTEVSFDEFELKAIFGPRIVYMGIDKLRESMRKFSEQKIKSIWEGIKKKVGKVKIKDKDGFHSIRAYLSLKEFVEQNELSGLAVECYPELMGEICLAYSLLAEEGIAGACEGDVNSCLAMLILYWLTGKPVHNTDLLAINEKDNSAVFSHCGSGGFSLAEKVSDITLSPVRLMDKGCCVLFPAKPGPVTMVNIVGRKETYRISIVTGKAIKTKMVFPGNPIRVRLPIDIQEIINTIARRGVGHHWMIGYGNVARELEEYADLIKINFMAAKEI